MTKYLPKPPTLPKKRSGNSSDPERKRGRPAAKSVSGCSSPQKLRSWAQEVLQVLDKPAVAVCIFIFGVIIIVVASKQLKMTFDILEYYWGGGRPQDGFIGNFMVIFVFMFVWLDTVILQWLKEISLQLHAFLIRRYHQLTEAIERIQEEDDIEELHRRKLMRQRKANAELNK